MHELSICGSIASIVSGHAAGRPVDVIHLRVGQLRQVVPDTLVYCWGLVSADTPLAGSRLAVESIPAAISCLECGTAHELTDTPLLVCPACRSGHIRVDAGEEFLITSLELAKA